MVMMNENWKLASNIIQFDQIVQSLVWTVCKTIIDWIILHRNKTHNINMQNATAKNIVSAAISMHMIYCSCMRMKFFHHFCFNW